MQDEVEKRADNLQMAGGMSNENLAALVRRMHERHAAEGTTEGPNLQVMAKTLEIHAPHRIVALLARLVQIDADALGRARAEPLRGELAARLGERLRWLQDLVDGGAPKSNAQAAMPAEAHDVLVPLELACAIAYFQLTPPRKRMESPSEVLDVLPMVAIALSAVAPLLRADGEGVGKLPPREVQAQLFDKARSNGTQALERLRIRRSDLDAAIVVLREARMSFGGGV